MTSKTDLPLATVQRLIKKTNGKLNCSKDAKHGISRAAGIFVLYLAHNANEICKEENKSTISVKHVLAAIEEIEFGNMIPQLEKSLENYRKAQIEKKNAKKARKAERELEKNKDLSKDNINNNNNINNTSVNNNNNITDEDVQMTDLNL